MKLPSLKDQAARWKDLLAGHKAQFPIENLDRAAMGAPAGFKNGDAILVVQQELVPESVVHRYAGEHVQEMCRRSSSSLPVVGCSVYVAKLLKFLNLPMHGLAGEFPVLIPKGFFFATPSVSLAFSLMVSEAGITRLKDCVNWYQIITAKMDDVIVPEDNGSVSVMKAPVCSEIAEMCGLEPDRRSACLIFGDRWPRLPHG